MKDLLLEIKDYLKSFDFPITDQHDDRFNKRILKVTAPPPLLLSPIEMVVVVQSSKELFPLTEEQSTSMTAHLYYFFENKVDTEVSTDTLLLINRVNTVIPFLGFSFAEEDHAVFFHHSLMVSSSAMSLLKNALKIDFKIIDLYRDMITQIITKQIKYTDLLDDLKNSSSLFIIPN